MMGNHGEPPGLFLMVALQERRGSQEEREERSVIVVPSSILKGAWTINLRVPLLKTVPGFKWFWESNPGLSAR